MVQIVPTILVYTHYEFKNTLEKIQGSFDLAQIDVMDGIFVPNTTFFNVEKINALTKNISYETHLMVADTKKYIKKSLQLKNLMRIYCHYESIKHQAHEILQSIKRSKIQAGIALNPQTSVDSVKHLLPDCDAVLIMSVQPGYSGQKFIPETVEKVRALRA